MVRGSLRYVVVAAFAVTGCSALLDVNDIYFAANAGGTNADGGEGGSPGDGGGSSDGGTEGALCMADLAADKLNCGRCGHSCLGGECKSGVCQAFEVSSVAKAPLTHVAVSDQHVFVSTRIRSFDEEGGVWRIPKGGGTAELYSPIRYSEGIAVLGDKLYFVVDDDPNDGAAKTGGFYSCPLVGPAPCAPSLIAASSLPSPVVVDNGRVLYGDGTAGKGIMAYTPPAAPVVFRAGFNPTSMFVSGEVAFFAATFTSPQTPAARLFEIAPDGGFAEKYAYYNNEAQVGRLTGDTSSLFFTAYDLQTTTGGVVRRIPRSGTGTPCDLGGAGNKRPHGIYADSQRVYWTNQGDGVAEPYQNGSLASCEQAGCCTTPTVMWTGNGSPTDVTGDADALYFVTYATGGVWKIAKP
jgi:hypothetical protein